MKPTEWKQLTSTEKKDIALNLFGSVRGNYIIGQALNVAIKELKQKEYPETSNIEDMEILGEQLFTIGYYY